MQIMNSDIRRAIQSSFADDQQADVLSALRQITLDHVMANSQANLDNTYLAILQLSKGNFDELQRLVHVAQKDFRDVIYWATLSK